MAQDGYGMIRDGLSLVASGFLDVALSHSHQWKEVRDSLAGIRVDAHYTRETLMALTQAQQAAVNELSQGINTLATNLGGALSTLGQVRNDLAEMTAEEGREEAERIRLQNVIDTLDNDVVGALAPLNEQVAAMNSSLQTPESAGGGPLTPESSGDAPVEPNTPSAPTEPDSAPEMPQTQL